jgi:hypothetical protein
MDTIKNFRLYGGDEYVVGTDIITSKQLSYDYGEEIANAVVNFFANKNNKNENYKLILCSDEELKGLEGKTKQ